MNRLSVPYAWIRTWNLNPPEWMNMQIFANFDIRNKYTIVENAAWKCNVLKYWLILRKIVKTFCAKRSVHTHIRSFKPTSVRDPFIQLSRINSVESTNKCVKNISMYMKCLTCIRSIFKCYDSPVKLNVHASHSCFIHFFYTEHIAIYKDTAKVKQPSKRWFNEINAFWYSLDMKSTLETQKQFYWKISKT